MKIITLPESEKALIQKAVHQDRLAQKKLFDAYASQMLSICRQYINDFQYAQDVMIMGFTKALKSLHTFDTEKSLGAWLRSIMIHESISFLRKNRNNWEQNIDDIHIAQESFSNTETDAIQYYIDQLPHGYKTVFLLYAVEGYKHFEIAQMLDISEGTSKSQLHKARTFLKNKITPEWEQNQSYGK